MSESKERERVQAPFGIPGTRWNRFALMVAGAAYLSGFGAAVAVFNDPTIGDAAYVVFTFAAGATIQFVTRPNRGSEHA